MIQLVNKLRQQLQNPLPGQDAQYRMAPVDRVRMDSAFMQSGQYRPSAVMILFCETEAGELFIPLIERMAYKGVHSAQIAFPGGKFEPSDEDLQQTALRECFEEIGVKDVDVIGKLTPLHIPVSSFLVHPFVGICTIKNPAMIHQEREVKTILKLKVDTLMNDQTIKQGTIETDQKMHIDTPYFEIGEFKVWGATAMILSELKQVIGTIF